MQLADIGGRIDQLIAAPPDAGDAAELLSLGENILEHWVRAKGRYPTGEKREGFRLLALHRQGADKDPSFNACRETCRELVYHYNLLTSGKHGSAHAQATPQTARMMAWVTRHLFLFICGKLETERLGEFCCASKPVRQTVDPENHTHNT